MARILGVDIPDNKRIVVALTYIYGIGPATSRKILAKVAVDESRRAKELSGEDLSRLATEIERGVVIEGQLRRQISQNISRLKAIKCYRGMRHRLNLPVRGQRTRTNARTRKGPRRTVAVKRTVKAIGA